MAEDSREGAAATGKDDFTRFAGNSIPEHYDRGLGPVLFAEFGERIARRAASYQPRRALETAAGTGIVTRLLRDLLPAGATLVATDLNAPMMEVAKTKFRADERVEFRAADAGDLPFLDGAFDVAVCQFGVMFFPDKAKSYRETRRVLADGGRYPQRLRLAGVQPLSACRRRTAGLRLRDRPAAFLARALRLREHRRDRRRAARRGLS